MRRDSRMTKPPLRPKGGWTLVVQPLSRQKGKVSVAQIKRMRRSIKYFIIAPGGGLGAGGAAAVLPD